MHKTTQNMKAKTFNKCKPDHLRENIKNYLVILSRRQKKTYVEAKQNQDYNHVCFFKAKANLVFLVFPYLYGC